MDEEYDQTGVDRVLLKNFKRIFETQNFSEEDLVDAVNDQQGPSRLLRYLHNSKYVTDTERQLVARILATVEEINDGSTYYSKGGATTVSVINEFTRLMNSMGVRGKNGVIATKSDGQGVVAAKGHGSQVREVKFSDVTEKAGNKALLRLKVEQGVTKEINVFNETQKTGIQPDVNVYKENKLTKPLTRSMISKDQANPSNTKNFTPRREITAELDKANKEVDWVVVEDVDEDNFVMV